MEADELKDALIEFEREHTIELLARTIFSALYDEEIYDTKTRALIRELQSLLTV